MPRKKCVSAGQPGWDFVSAHPVGQRYKNFTLYTTQNGGPKRFQFLDDHTGQEFLGAQQINSES